MSTSALRSSASPDHYTPPEIIDRVRTLVGGKIELDPASSPIGNTIVGAGRFFTEADDGLTQPWAGSAFVNPPGGKIHGKSSQLRWWAKTVDEWTKGNVKEAVFIGFNLELVRLSQGCQFSILDVPVCFPCDRIPFYQERDGVLQPQTRPVHANVIAYLPPEISDEACARFEDAFGWLGRVVLPSFAHGRSLKVAKARPAEVRP